MTNAPGAGTGTDGAAELVDIRMPLSLSLSPMKRDIEASLPLEQVRLPHPQRHRQLRQIQHRDVALAPLHRADVGAVKPGFEGQGFLRQPPLLAQAADALPQAGKVGLLGFSVRHE